MTILSTNYSFTIKFNFNSRLKFEPYQFSSVRMWHSQNTRFDRGHVKSDILGITMIMYLYWFPVVQNFKIFIVFDIVVTNHYHIKWCSRTCAAVSNACNAFLYSLTQNKPPLRMGTTYKLKHFCRSLKDKDF